MNNIMLKAIFLISIFLIIYAYILYPITVYMISIFRKNEIAPNNNLPYVTVIIAAYNEEKRILKKIENMLTINYPKGKLQIIVASDGSTDKTIEIVESYKEAGIELVAIDERCGKENAQKESLSHAKGEIIIFTDVSTMLDSNGVKQIVSNFADSTVGCVSSEDRVVGKEGKETGESLYVRYEMWLRKLESRVNSPVGLSGSFFAARKIVCQNFSEDMDSDFRTLLNTVKMGMRGTCDSKAIGYYLDVSDPRHEFERKVRTVLRGLTLFFRNTEFLNIFKYGLFSYQFFCHKLLRWIVPFLLIIVFFINIFLAWTSKIYFALLLAQLVMYSSVVLLKKYDIYSSSSKILKIPIYFIIVNASIFVAWWRYMGRHRVVVWTPSER